MTTNTLTADDALIARGQLAVARLTLAYEAIPSDGDLPGSLSQNERDAVSAQRQTLLNHRPPVQLGSRQLAEFLQRLGPLTAWRDLLTTAKADFAARLATTPNTDRTFQFLAPSLVMIERGPRPDDGGVMPQILYDWFVGHGEPRTFGCRGGLTNNERRIEELEKRITEVRADLTARIGQAEAIEQPVTV